MFQYPIEIEDLPHNDPFLEEQVKQQASQAARALCGAHVFNGNLLLSQGLAKKPESLDGDVFPFDIKQGKRVLYYNPTGRLEDLDTFENVELNNEKFGGNEFKHELEAAPTHITEYHWGWIGPRAVTVVHYDNKRYLLWVDVDKYKCLNFGKYTEDRCNSAKKSSASVTSFTPEKERLETNSTVSTLSGFSRRETNVPSERMIHDFDQQHIKKCIMPILSSLFGQSFRGIDLVQLGRKPQFFNPKSEVRIPDIPLAIWEGFKAVPQFYNGNTYINIESVRKFVPTYTCLDEIRSQKQLMDKKSPQALSHSEFLDYWTDFSVVTLYGNKRAYKVKNLMENANCDEMFLGPSFNAKKEEEKNEPQSISQYFKTQYNITLVPKQPVFVASGRGGSEIYLPSQVVAKEGIPEHIRNDTFKMREVFKQCQRTPNNKMDNIGQVVSMMKDTEVMEEWGISISQEPATAKVNVLDTPTLANGDKATEATLRRLPIQDGVNLENWICVYQDYSAADSVYSTMIKAEKQLGMKVYEPFWIEFDRRKPSVKEIEEIVVSSIKKCGGPGKVQIAMIVLQHESDYKMWKDIFYKHKVVTQCLTLRNAKKSNLSVISNIMRQMTAKNGGDLYNINFKAKLPEDVMLLGMDVCHKGPNSIVGFCATYEESLCQYFSQHIYLPPRTEIVKVHLKTVMINALYRYKLENGHFPKHVIFYRDGLGESQRSHSLRFELPQLKNALKTVGAEDCKLMVCVVNKRISQRFF